MTKHKLIIVGLIGVLIYASCSTSPKDDKTEKPNILLIMADDMGFSDIGCYGGEVQTPNLDQLAANGVRFSQFYNAARCCPTRASLMTGLYPHQTGIGHMTNTPTNPIQHNYGYPGYLGYLNQHCLTLGELLKENGYNTMMCGKWHLGYHGKEKWPLQRGFDQFYGILSGATNYFKPEAPRGLSLGNEPVEPEENYYITDAFTDHAIDFIKAKEQSDKPFFMYLAYTSPHWPLNALQEDIDKYRRTYMQGWSSIRDKRLQKMKEIGLIKEDVELSAQAGPNWDDLPQEKKEEMDLRMSIYAAQIDRMDQNIGKMISYLEQSGQLDNTIVMFLSDNGGCAEGGMMGGGNKEILGTKGGYFLTYGEAWANTSNTPFKLYKHWVHEGGISTPFIVHWPKGIDKSKNGSWINQYAFLPDIAASIKEITNSKYPETYKGKEIYPLAGESFFKTIDNNEAVHDNPIFWEHEGNCAVRFNQYKLVKKYPGDWELYDILNDRAESVNLINEKPELAKNLIASYNEWENKSLVVDWKVITSKFKNH